MSDLILFNGVEIADIPVINRPSYFLVNNYGRESYMTILEPIEDFRKTPERVMLANNYKSVMQLSAAFKEVAPVGNTESGYNRKDTIEVFFMGFRWRWRPNHKSFYGGITVGYELLPIIARWIVLTGAVSGIDNKNLAYLPPKYEGGTGKGFGGIEVDPPEVDPVKYSEDVQRVLKNNKLVPIVHAIAGTVERAAQLNIIPKEAFEVYDGLMHSIWNHVICNIKSVHGCKYVMSGTDAEQHAMFIGGFYGAAKVPDWATEISTGSKNGVVVTIVKIKADTIEEAEGLMTEILK